MHKPKGEHVFFLKAIFALNESLSVFRDYFGRGINVDAGLRDLRLRHP